MRNDFPILAVLFMLTFALVVIFPTVFEHRNPPGEQYPYYFYCSILVVVIIGGGYCIFSKQITKNISRVLGVMFFVFGIGALLKACLLH